MRYSLIAINCRYTHSCLSLFYVRNELLKHLKGSNITLADFTINDPYFNTLSNLLSLTDDALFFSMYIWNADYVLRLVADISKVKPSLPIILGGPQVSALNLQNLPEQCTIVYGEIEGLSPSFYTDLQQGILKKHYSGGANNPFDFPYTDNDLAERLSDRNIYYESSRGCPFSCSYCLSSADKNMRNKDITTVKEELTQILSHKPRIIRFVDRTFNASSKRALEIWSFLAKHGGETAFHFEIAPDLFNAEMFSFLEKIKPGIFEFEVGIQSTHPQTLEAVHRKTDLPKALGNIRQLMKLDTIHLHIDLILGLPYETKETFACSFNDMFSILPHYIQMGLLKILPETPISRETEDFDILFCCRAPYQVLSTRWLNSDTLIRMYWFGECVESFYNNRFFRSFFRYIQRKESGFSFFSTLLDHCLHSGFFQQAKTQKLMSTLLLEIASDRKDKEIIRELLRYDWLRSGNRFLPENITAQSLKKEKDRLWQELPQEYLPLYTRKTRNYFFKQSLFASFSKEALEEIGIAEDDKTTVCFLPERENSALELHKAILVA